MPVRRAPDALFAVVTLAVADAGAAETVPPAPGTATVSVTVQARWSLR